MPLPEFFTNVICDPFVTDNNAHNLGMQIANIHPKGRQSYERFLKIANVLRVFSVFSKASLASLDVQIFSLHSQPVLPRLISSKSQFALW